MRASLIALGLSLALLPVPAARAGVDLRALPPAGRTASDTAALAVVGDVNGDGRTDTASGLQDDPRTRDAMTLDEIAVIGFGPSPPAATAAGFSGLVESWATRSARPATSTATAGRTWRSRWRA